MTDSARRRRPPLIEPLRRRRLAKFGAGFGIVTVVMILVGVLAFFDTAATVDAENHWAVVQNITLVVATAIVGFGTMGVVLIRPTVKQIEELAAHTQAIEDGRLDTGVSSDAEDELGTLYDSINSMRETIRARIEETETQRERAEKAREESRELATTLEARTEAFAETMARTAEGDLTARLAVEDDDPESLRRVAGSFNDAVAELESVVGEVGTFTGSVVTAVERSTTHIDEAVSQGRETSDSMDETAEDARRQKRDDMIQQMYENTESMTQQELADAVGLSRSRIGDILSQSDA